MHSVPDWHWADRPSLTALTMTSSVADESEYRAVETLESRSGLEKDESSDSWTSIAFSRFHACLTDQLQRLMKSCQLGEARYHITCRYEYEVNLSFDSNSNQN